MKSADIREAFLQFFEQKGHTRVASSSLVPTDDPTLLFTNAGMNQFKECFLGLDKRSYTRAVSSQKCVRAGGKHNDLENVGYTARHHTFFEMLGNFSFGDYFKQDAIDFAWEFLTSAEWLNIPKDKLTVTVYASDDEAYDIWQTRIGVPAERIIRIGDNKGGAYASDNFWAMGDTGPCGPCSEIFYDHGADIPGGPPGSPDEDGDRFIEIWNNVFMQFNRTADGVMHPLPAPSVDTGMGLERISAVMQHVHANYEIDLFQSLLAASAQAIGCENNSQASLKVVADHIRSCAFLIADGVLPSNEGRGYVLRRIIRRACRHGNKLGANGPFFSRIIDALAAEMGDAYPQLREQAADIAQALLAEEEQFARTLTQGLRILDADLAELVGTIIPGPTVFRLYDTYGFPVDLTADIARERDLSLDMAGFEAEMHAQRERARASSRFDIDYNALITLDGDTVFVGHEHTASMATVRAIYRDGQRVGEANVGENVAIVLDKTAFYAESGGQIGDAGVISAQGLRVDVRDTKKSGLHHVHHALVTEGVLREGSAVEAEVDNATRRATARNHSATHLLHAALREILGKHVQQKGSLVTSDYLRFDFSHPEAIAPEQLRAVEARVNEHILGNTAVQTELTDIETARTRGAMALFGEKYGDVVRVLSMGEANFSVELCGGTHVARTGDIGLLRITSESGVAAGVRRIEARSGLAAMAWLNQGEQTLAEVAALVKTNRDSVTGKVQQLLERQRELEKSVDQLKAKAAATAGANLTAQTVTVAGVPVLAARLDGVDAKVLRENADQLRNQLGDAVVLLASVIDAKVSLVAMVSKALTATIKAGDLVSFVAQQVGGKGGGRPDMAMAGGTEPENLEQALASVEAYVASKMAAPER
ncbi:alanyl-tRNA synthetase [Paraperlucidibaca baekdonensis]|uniref:Alanine--tRNA ligase n=1 Tax=Paraperlucidibaca baekdonensis TaxID=748120 RepID=A0A3E0H2W0_9GAMM|nr:alanine--tRNA ligase [Paraperlucidibaca baekdonensis]REH37687.1 alanyl-tRNA synthetase [Paraperlucidibaca baekdonensis]